MKTESALSLDELEQLEALCLRHENATNDADRDLEVLLAEVSGITRRYFLRELLWQDIEKRQRSGERVSFTDYSFSSTDDSNIAKDVFEELSKESAPGESTELPDRYQKLEEIGSGGIGVVWRVFDQRAQRPLAVKMLRSKFRSDRHANIRLEREAILTGALQHPGVPPVHDHGQLTDRSVFFAMKLIEGQTLGDILENRSTDDAELQKKIGVFEKVAQTMAYVHSKDVVHRDLKPENIMVGKFAEVQVMDWGMAKRLNAPNDQSGMSFSLSPELSTKSAPTNGATPIENKTVTRSNESSINDRSLTRFGDILGTPRYMAPEQARGERDVIDARADVFSMGSILFEILTGKRLYADVDSSEILAKAVAGDLSQSLPELEKSTADSKLVALCRDCLSPIASDRPKHAGIVANEIREHFANVQQRVKAAEMELREAEVRVNEEAKRRRTFSRMLMLVAGVFAIGLSGILWQWNQARKSATLADSRFRDAKETVDEYLIKVSSSSELSVSPGTQKIRKNLLEKARDYYVKFVESDPDDPILQDELAAAHFSLGNIAVQLGSDQDNIDHFQQAIAISERLIQEGNEQPDTAMRICQAHTQIEQIHFRNKRYKKAIDCGKTGLDIANELFGPEPTDSELLQIADHEHNLGNSYVNLLGPNPRETLSQRNGNEMELATSHYNRALSIFDAQLQQDQSNRSIQLSRARTLLGMASMRFVSEKHVEATELYREALDIQVKHGGQPSELTSTANWLANSLSNYKDRVEILRQSVERLDDFCAKNPLRLAERVLLHDSRKELCRSLSLAGMKDEALEVFEKLIRDTEADLERYPDSVELLDIRQRSLVLSFQFKQSERRQEIVSHEEKAIAISRRLQEMVPERRTEFIDDELGSFTRIGILNRRTRFIDEAISSYEKRLERITALNIPEVTIRTVPETRNNLGYLYHMEGEPELALKNYEIAAPLYLECSNGDRLDRTYSFYGSTLGNIGTTLCTIGKFEAAVEKTSLAIKTIGEVLEQRPRRAALYDYLSEAYLARAESYELLGRFDSAQKNYDALLKILKSEYAYRQTIEHITFLVEIKKLRLQIRQGNYDESLSKAELLVNIDAILEDRKDGTVTQKAPGYVSDHLATVADLFAAAIVVIQKEDGLENAELELQVEQLAAKAAKYLTAALSKNNFGLIGPLMLPNLPHLKSIWDREELEEVAARIESMVKITHP